ncbi:hypothetical protein B0H17DRAFT_1124895 [Mycena rosella]|uniref:C2H2-type domain-containing protein n=1 Tax=Mycena rosella TaxID=1033263 RepID=A0AAD7MAJ9_MYCRO|nr:hypothetical protein B0H17DRAFT_1124895 [Mycena rosella]
MPRVATTSTSRSHRLPTGGKTPPCPPLDIHCPVDGCLWTFARQGCLNRHMHKHKSPEEREKLMIHCAEPGCTHKTLQKSNMNTHYIAKHTGLKPHMCDKCSYCAADPSCLHRHVLAIHPLLTSPDADCDESEQLSKTKGRSRKPKRVSATLPSQHASPVACSPSSDYYDASRNVWTTPSPASSIESLPYSLAYPSSPPDDATSSAWNTPSPASPIESLAYLHSPSSDHFASYPPAASPDAMLYLWDAEFEAACAAMVAPTPAPGPATQYPAQHIDPFQTGDLPAFLPELELALEQPVHNAPQAFPQLSYTYEQFTLESLFASDRLAPPFVSEWDTTAY